MAKKQVAVTSAQRSAAKAMVSRSALTGRTVSPSVTKIANAKPVKIKLASVKRSNAKTLET